jgi:hypothetical protein
MGLLSGIVDWLLDWLIPEEEAQGQTLTKSGTNQKVPVVYGEQMVGGIEIFKRSSDISGGPWNDYLHLVYVLCEGEIDTIGTVFFNGISEHDPKWGGSRWVHIERFNGADGQSACQTLINHGVGWSSTDKLSGLAYVYIRLRQNGDQNIFRGVPKITVHISKGKKVKNLATNVVEYSNVAPYCLADYISRPRYGRAASEISINKDSFIAAAAITHQAVGGTENQNIVEIDTIGAIQPNWLLEDWSGGGDRWLELGLPSLTRWVTNQVIINTPLMPCDVTIDTSQDLFKNINVLRAGMRGMTPNSIGEMELLIEDSGLPTFAFDASNIEKGVELTKKSRGRKSNQVTVTFKNKALNFEDDQVVYPETGSVVHTEWLAEDNDVPLPVEVTADTLINKASVMKWAEVVANLSRDLSNISFKGTPDTESVRPGDIVSVTDPFYGWVTKAFRVTSVAPLKTGSINYKMTEHQDSIYPWANPTYSQDYPKTDLSDPFILMPPTGVEATVINDDQVRVKWYKSGDPNVFEYVIIIKDAATDAEFKTLITSDDTQLFTDLGSGDYKVVAFARSSFGVSQEIEVLFTVSLPIVYPPIHENDGTRIYFVPNDVRVVKYAEAIQFRYSLTNDFATATVYAGNPSANLIITNADSSVPYHVWYGNGIDWYYILLRATDLPSGSSYTGTIEYYKLTNTTTAPTIASGSWLTSPQIPVSNNRYLWNYNKNTRTIGADIDSPVSLITQYVKDGKGISSITDAYQLGASATIAPTGAWSGTFSGAGAVSASFPYMWNRTTIAYTEGNDLITTNMIAARGSDSTVEGPASTVEGPRGAAQFYTTGTGWLPATADAAITGSGFTKRVNDRVTISSASPVFSQTRYWDGSVWQSVNTVIDGTTVVNGLAIIDSLATGDIAADKVKVADIDISAANWGDAVIINAIGIPVDYYGFTGTAFQQVNVFGTTASIGSYYVVEYGQAIRIDLDRAAYGQTDVLDAYGIKIDQRSTGVSGIGLDITSGAGNTSRGIVVDSPSGVGGGIYSYRANGTAVFAYSSDNIGLVAQSASSGLFPAISVIGDLELEGSGSGTVGRITVNGFEVYHAGNLPSISLSDSVTSDSTTTAASSKAVKEAYDKGNSALARTGGALTGALTSSNDITTTGVLTAGYASGGVAMTINDGAGNANVTFNHASGIPNNDKTTQSSARIRASTDNDAASLDFSLGDSTTTGISRSLDSVLNLTTSLVTSFQPLTVTGTVTAYGFVGALMGNADTVTNGVYTNTTQTITGTKTFTGGFTVTQLSLFQDDVEIVGSVSANGVKSLAGITVGNINASGNLNNGKGIAIGDSQTGIRQSTTGILESYSSNIRVTRQTSTSFDVYQETTILANLNIEGSAFCDDYLPASDRRYKENERVIDNPIEKLMGLTGYTYNWIGKPDNRVAHTMAQDVQVVFPEAVKANPKGKLHVSVAAEVALLVEVCKSQQQEIDKLKEDLSTIMSHLNLRKT